MFRNHNYPLKTKRRNETRFSSFALFNNYVPPSLPALVGVYRLEVVGGVAAQRADIIVAHLSGFVNKAAYFAAPADDFALAFLLIALGLESRLIVGVCQRLEGAQALCVGHIGDEQRVRAEVADLDDSRTDDRARLPAEVGDTLRGQRRIEPAEFIGVAPRLKAEVLDSLDRAAAVKHAQGEHSAFLDKLAGVAGVQHRNRDPDRVARDLHTGVGDAAARDFAALG